MRDFLKHTLATFLGLLLFCGCSIGGLIYLLIAVSSKDAGPEVQEKSVLVVDLAQNITDSKTPADALNGVLAGRDRNTITLRTVLDAVNKATTDKRIVGVYIYGDSGGASSTGFATLKEVRQALQRFRAAGKPIFAYDVDWREREYYLGSVANTIAVNPIGSLELNGLSSETTFFTGALQKFGVGVQVTRVGKYKSAVEPFLLTKRSPESREQTEKLLGDLWQEFLTAAGKDRKLTVPQLQVIADSKGTVMAKEAQQAGLVDRVVYDDEIEAELKQLTGENDPEKSFRQVDLGTYARAIAKDITRNSKHKVAVVYAEGAIVNGVGAADMVGGDRLTAQLRDLRLNPDVKAVVLRVNSPGGSATASEIIQREIVLLRQAKKPIVVSMGDVAASGGYWIATYGDRIFAQPNTITGSIGVFGQLFNVQKIANANGITWDVVKTGKFADHQTISRPKTPEELALIQRSVNQIYDQFLTKVADSRKLKKVKVAQIAQGRIWSGVQAKSLGLVDELGGLDEAIQAAVKQAKLGNDWQLLEATRRQSWRDQILDQFLESQIATPTPSTDLLTQGFQQVQADLSVWQTLNDPRGVYLRLPFNFRIN
jgi:protease IV